MSSSTVITSIAIDKQQQVAVNAANSTLTEKQIRILSVLAVAVAVDYDLHHSSYTVTGNVMVEDSKYENFSWVGDVITHTLHDNNGAEKLTQQLEVYTFNRYTVVRGSITKSMFDHFIALTFKDGLLKGIGGQPSFKIGYQGDDHEISWSDEFWFYRNVCFNKTNPHLPSVWKNVKWREHRNEQGQLHRPVVDGPACYIVDANGVFVDSKRNTEYYVNGERCDEHGEHWTVTVS